jgi:hypothetical protein
MTEADFEERGRAYALPAGSQLRAQISISIECLQLRCCLEPDVADRAGWEHHDLRLRHAEPAEWAGEFVGGIVWLRLRCALSTDFDDPAEWGEYQLQLPRCRKPGSGAVAASRSNDGAARCGYRPESIGIDCTEVEERWLGHGNSSVSICVRRRRAEGNKEPEQRITIGRAGLASASHLAGAHTVSLRRRLNFCQSALSRQNSIYLSNPLPTSHSSRNRETLWTQEQQASTDRMAHAAPVAGHTADFERGERQSCTVAASAHDAEDYAGALCASGFGRPTEGSQQGRPDGASDEFFREVESEKRDGTCLRIGVSLVLGVRGCPKPNLSIFPNCCEIMVSAAGFEPATHALKGRSVASTRYMFQ